jgi:protein Mpv17
MINVIIYLLGDWLSQTIFQKRNILEFDISRTLRNGFIGLCFGPLVHEYYQFSDTILPPEDGLVTRLEKIVMDQTIYLTVKCSIYISAVGLLGGDDWQTVQQTVKDKIGGIVFTAWKFWPLVHCITYGLIPARHRILWVNSVDLIWNAILATKAQKNKPEVENEVVQAVLVNAETDIMHGAVVSSETKLPPVLVLDNQWVEDHKGQVAEILSPMSVSGGNTNMTADALAA